MIRLLTALAISALFSSCASYRVVKVKPNRGGIIALKPGWEGMDAARMKAEMEMRRTCSRGHRVVSEGEAVIGSRSYSKTRARRRRSTILTGSNTSSEARNVTEWRLKYKCRRR